MAVIERLDASVREEWDTDTRTYRRWGDGQLVEERPFTDVEGACVDEQARDARRATAQAALVDRIRIALASNSAYLDKVTAGTATTADHIAQVPALTRQMQAVIRLIAGSDLLDQSI